MIDRFPCVGKNETSSANGRVFDCDVMQLMCSYLNREKNITTDNYFTTVDAA